MRRDASTMTKSERSFERITKPDLRRLREIAEQELNALFDRRPVQSGAFRNRMFLLALCQGAAKHFVDGRHGVKDLDVWAFFRPLPNKRFPPRTRLKADFGTSKFGRHPADSATRFHGRRVDVLGRDIDVKKNEPAEIALRRYLRSGLTATSRLLAQRPVVALWPERLFGRVIWEVE